MNIDSAQLTSTTRMSETEKEDRYKRRNLETSKKKKKKKKTQIMSNAKRTPLRLSG